MKTPRDLLFQRHQTAAPKLDALRRAVITQHCAAQPTVAESPSLPGDHTRPRVSVCAPSRKPLSLASDLLAKLWLELIFPCRRVWTTLAAVWLLLLIVNFAQRDGTSTLTAKAQPSPEMLLAFRSQQKMFNQILSDQPQPAEPARPRNLTPSPRTENSGITTAQFLLPRPLGGEGRGEGVFPFFCTPSMELPAYA